MKIIYTNAIGEETKHISCLYRDVARLLSEEALDSKGTVVRVVEEEHPEHYLVYNVGQRSGTRFITELENTMPDSYLDKEVSDRFLTCVDPEKMRTSSTNYLLWEICSGPLMDAWDR